MLQCYECDGDGRFDCEECSTCVCQGYGCTDCAGTGGFECQECYEGYVDCSVCGGTGQLEED